MASIGNDPNGRKRILFVAGDGSRKTIRIGKADRKQADAFRLKVEKIISANITGGALDDETSRWLAGLDDTIHDRLATAGLVKARTAGGATLRQLLDTYFSLLEVKPITVLGYQATRTALLQHFGEQTPVRDIASLQAAEWRRKMKADGLAQATISKRIGIAKHVFKCAVKWKMLTENPFAEVRAGTQKNKSRQYFISRQDADKVLAECPDSQWRLIFALSRFGGLRCPSEHLGLKWSDVNWELGRIRVRCTKTEHHEGHEERFVPIFPELRPHLLDAFDQADVGTEHVITRYRQANCNLRTQLERIIRKAGLSPWPRLFHNLRSTRQTELTERFPSHVVTAWIGNTERVAEGHYLQVTDTHFSRAIQIPESAAQNPAQSGAELAGIERNADGMDIVKTTNFPHDADCCKSLQILGIAATGLEPVTRGL